MQLKASCLTVSAEKSKHCVISCKFFKKQIKKNFSVLSLRYGNN